MSSSPPRVLKRPAHTAEKVFQRLVAAILEGDFEPGASVRESALAQRWHVSRTPLREAVRRAAETGLLILRPNQAPLVRPISADDVRSLYELRELLEVHALRSAWRSLVGRPCEKMLAAARRIALSRTGLRKRCLKFDLTLHLWWSQHCDNPWLKADLERHFRFLRIFQRWIGRDAQALIQAHQEHLRILTAIRDGDQNRACQALADHIRSSTRLVEAALAHPQTRT